MKVSQQRRRGGRVFRIAARMLLWLAIATAGIVAWLHWAGVPAWLRDRILAEFRARGVMLRIERVRFSLWQGIVLDGASWYARPRDARPALHADRVHLDCAWLDALLGRPFLQHIEVAGGGVDLMPSVAGGRFAVTNIALAAGFEPGGLRIDRLLAPLPDIELHARGYIVGFGSMQGGKSKPTPVWPDEALVRKWADRIASWEVPSFDPGSQAEVEFVACPDEPERSEATFRGAGKGLRARGLLFDRWSISGTWKTGMVTVLSARLGQGTNEVRGTATVSPARRTLGLRVNGSIPASFVRAAPLPPVPAARLARADLRLADPLVLEVQIAEGPWTNALERIAGRIRLPRSDALGIPIEQADIRFRREGPRVHFDGIDAVIGHDGLRGPLRGEGTFDLASGVYAGQGTAAFDPSVLMPLMHPVQIQFVGATIFRSAPPDISFKLSGQLSDMSRLVLAAEVRAHDFVYQGGLVVEASAHVTASNEVMRVDNLCIVRREGRASGWIEQNFRTRQARMDVHGDADPHAIARMVAPAVHRFTQRFRVEGPVRWQVAGTVDYGGLRENDLRFAVDAERFGLRWFVAEQVRFDGTVRGRRVEIQNLKGRLCSGAFAGNAVFELPDAGRLETRYAIDGRIDDTDFQLLMQQLTDAPQVAYEGRLDATLRLGGLMGPGQARTAAGGGTLAIRNGRLFQIALFGWFSRFLNSLYPGLGFAQQSDFKAGFTIAGGRASTDQAELLGELVTMRGRGSYSFDERLNFAIEAKLLRGGIVAEVFRLLTLPLTKLFEFDLVGTLRRPEWRPHNLPEALWRRP